MRTGPTKSFMAGAASKGAGLGAAGAKAGAGASDAAGGLTGTALSPKMAAKGEAAPPGEAVLAMPKGEAGVWPAAAKGEAGAGEKGVAGGWPAAGGSADLATGAAMPKGDMPFIPPVAGAAAVLAVWAKPEALGANGLTGKAAAGPPGRLTGVGRPPAPTSASGGGGPWRFGGSMTGELAAVPATGTAWKGDAPFDGAGETGAAGDPSGEKPPSG